MACANCGKDGHNGRTCTEPKKTDAKDVTKPGAPKLPPAPKGTRAPARKVVVAKRHGPAPKTHARGFEELTVEEILSLRLAHQKALTAIQAELARRAQQLEAQRKAVLDAMGEAA